MSPAARLAQRLTVAEFLDLLDQHYPSYARPVEAGIEALADLATANRPGQSRQPVDLADLLKPTETRL